MNAIGRVFDRHSTSIFGLLAPSGGIRPPPQQSVGNSGAMVAMMAIEPRKLTKPRGTERIALSVVNLFVIEL